MTKSSFVSMTKGKKKYKLYATDIKDVHKLIVKKRPTLPKFECQTQDDIQSTNKETIFLS